MLSLDSLLTEASSFISAEFNLRIQQSKLKPYSSENWKKFCQANGFEESAGGLYVPQSYSAYVNAESPFLVPTVFHELYGHGLFCEQSQLGMKLVEITQKGDNGANFFYDEINPQIQPLGLCNQNIGNYEGFAVWMESLLSEEVGDKKIWDTKKEGMPQFYRSLYDNFQEAEQKLTRLGFMAQLGFPKHYSGQDIVNVLRHLYGSRQFANIDFVILYGSRKPHSDIDLCVVSTNPSTQYFNGWLDIAELNREDFQHRLDHLDIALTDAMFSGELIYGDANHFARLKQKVLDIPITDKVIVYNLTNSRTKEEYLPHYNQNTRLRDLCLSYTKSYLRNAEELRKGRKALTLREL